MKNETKQTITGLTKVLQEINRGQVFAVAAGCLEVDGGGDIATQWQRREAAVSSCMHLTRAVLIILKAYGMPEIAEQVGLGTHGLTLEFLAMQRENGRPENNVKGGNNGTQAK